MQEIHIQAITGVNESVDPQLLNANELVSLENMIIGGEGEGGKPVKRGAFRKNNQDTASGAIRALYDAVDENDTNYLLAAASTSIEKSLNGTGTFSTVKSGLNGSASVRFLELGKGRYLVTNGTDKPFILFGDGFSTSLNLEIAAPDISGVVTNHGSGGYLSEGHYRYLLVYGTETGERSNPSNPVTHYKNTYGSIASTDSSDKKLRLKNLPVSSDSRVTKRYVYRTKALSNSDSMHVYYLRAVLNNSDTTFEDDGLESSDDKLYLNDSPVYQQVPLKAGYMTRHRGRLFMGNVTLRKKNYFGPPHAKTDPAPGSWSAGYEFSIIDYTYNNSGPYDGEEYQYRCVFVDEDGIESDPVDTEFTRLNGGGAYPDKVKVDLGHIPFAGTGTAARPNAKRRIYRTKRGDGNHYLLGEFEISTIDQLSVLLSPYGDTVNDDELGEQYREPENVTYKSALVYSEALQPANISTENLALVFEDDGDKITAVHDDLDGVLLFKNNSICKLYTSGSPVNWRVAAVSKNIGCDHPGSIVKVDRAYFFRSGIHFYKYGGGITMLSQKMPLTMGAYQTTINAAYFPDKRWYTVAVTDGSHDYILVYDENTVCWYCFTIGNAYSVLRKKYGNDEGRFLIGGYHYLLYYDVHSDEDDVSDLEPAGILTRMKTGVFLFDDGISMARLRKFYLDYENSGSITLTLRDPDKTGDESQRVVSLDPGTTGAVSWRIIPDAMLTGTLSTAAKLQIEISGTGLRKFHSARLHYLKINRGTRR